MNKLQETAHKSPGPYFLGKLKLLFYYYLTCFPFDILLALGMTAGVASFKLELGAQADIIQFLLLVKIFLFNLVIFGTFGGAFIYNRFRRHEYFLFYNKGLGKGQLIFFSISMNSVLAIILLLVIYWLGGGV